MDRLQLTSEVEAVLRDSRPQTAREIARSCEVPRREVESLLHVDLRDRVIRDAGFRWSFSETASPEDASRREAMFALNAPAREFIPRFLERRGLENPDGRELYAYRCSETEFEALHFAISDVVDFDPFGRSLPIFGPQFVLYAAEWWRRHQAPGAWAWEPVFDSIELHVGNIMSVYPAVIAGLESWRRPLLQRASGRMFLVTLACEGGLPLQVVKREGARLREFFRRVLEDYGLYSRTGVRPAELARRNQGYLSASLRQEIVFELGGRLIENVWLLQERVRGAKDPVAELDRVDRSWREQLPFEVSDDVAETFLNNLVRTAQRVREGVTEDFRFTRAIVRRGSEWSLRADLSFPPFVSAEWMALATRIKADDLASKGQFVLFSSSGARRPIISATQRYRNGESLFQFERLGQVDSIEGSLAADSWTIGFESVRTNGARREIRGAALLSPDTPWVFAEVDEGRWRFLGQGSVRTRFSSCAVLFPESLPLAEGEVLGTVEGRMLREITNSVEAVDAEGGRFRILLGQAEETAALVEADGDRCTFLAEDREVFLGRPNLREIGADGRTKAIGESRIQWRPTGSRDWRSWNDSCVGRVTVRVVEHDETRFQQVVEILPRGFELKLKGASDTGGTITISAVLPFVVSREFGEEMTAELRVQGSSTEISLRSATRRVPASVSLALDFGEGRTIALRAPFPARGVRFVGLGDRVLRHGSTVTLQTLELTRVEVFASPGAQRYVVDGVLDGRDIRVEDHVAIALQLPEAWNGRIALELRRIGPEIHGLLAQSDDPDAMVALQVDGFGPNKLFVRRYERQFNYQDEHRIVSIVDAEGSPAPAEGDHVELVRLWNPAAGRVALTPDGEGAWRTDVATREPGPWLLLASTKGGAAVRPRLLHVPGEDTASGVLGSAIKAPSVEEAAAAIGEALEQLAGHPMDEEWTIVVMATLRMVREVPPATFLLTARLCKNPAAAVMALIHSGADRQLVWDALQDEGFEWYVVPVDTWASVLESYVAALAEQLEAVGIATGMALAEAESFIEFLEESADRAAMLPVWTFLRAQVLHDVTGLLRQQAGASPGIVIPSLMEARAHFLTRHADDHWPYANRVKDMLDSSKYVPTNLLARLSGEARFQRAAIGAPLLAAKAAVDGLRVGRRARGDLRTLRRFDPAWFDEAYCLALAMFLGEKIMQEIV